ncbi:MAG: hypothetical protein AAGG57_14225 [Pseudomonadota bacterium]
MDALEVSLLKCGWAIAPGIVASTTAVAAVCDKVRPVWNPADGPVNQLEDLALFFIEPLGLIVLVPTITIVLLRKIWLTAIVSLNISTWIEADDIANFAI